MPMNIWNFHARIYEKLWVQKLSLKPTRQAVINFLQEILPNRNGSLRVLDVGCGTGQLLREIQALFGTKGLYTGIDSAPDMIRIARESSNSITYEVQDADSLNIGNARYDVIVCTHSLPYYKNQRGFLQIISTKLAPGGYAIIAHASCNTIYDHIIMFFVKLTTGPAHYPSISEFGALSQNIFKIDRTLSIPTKFFVPSLIMHVLKGINE